MPFQLDEALPPSGRFCVVLVPWDSPVLASWGRRAGCFFICLPVYLFLYLPLDTYNLISAFSEASAKVPTSLSKTLPCPLGGLVLITTARIHLLKPVLFSN